MSFIFEKKMMKSFDISPLGIVHIITLKRGGGGQRFVMKPFKNIGICMVLRYERGGGGQNLRKSRYVL
jgi:hypothetical protein